MTLERLYREADRMGFGDDARAVIKTFALFLGLDDSDTLTGNLIKLRDEINWILKYDNEEEGIIG